jgi:hypothetical protein
MAVLPFHAARVNASSVGGVLLIVAIVTRIRTLLTAQRSHQKLTPTSAQVRISNVLTISGVSAKYQSI